MKKVSSKILFGGLFLLVLGGSLFPYRKPASFFLWEKTHCACVSLLNSKDALLDYRIAEYYFSPADYNLDQAKKYYEKTLALEPTWVKPHYQLGRIHFLQGKFNPALAEFDRVLDLNPDYSRGYYMKGLTLGYYGNLIDATKAFKRFIELEPEGWAGYNDLSWLYFQLGEYAKVRDVSLEGLSRAPENVWLLNMHGLALLNLGEKEGAKEYFSLAKARADKMEPKDWGVAYPGNDPSIYAEGLERMRETIGHNLTLVETGS
ncbi:MAG: tetratricopeptide repeat protein [Candidatus Moraniibacteriota bacterium]